MWDLMASSQVFKTIPVRPRNVNGVASYLGSIASRDRGESWRYLGRIVIGSRIARSNITVTIVK